MGSAIGQRVAMDERRSTTAAPRMNSRSSTGSRRFQARIWAVTASAKRKFSPQGTKNSTTTTVR